MLQSSPYRSLAWQYLGPTNISGRATDIAVAERGATRRIYAAYATSGVWKTDDDGATLAGDLRESAVDEHRRHRGRAVQPRHRLGRHRRGQHLSRLDAWRRHLQVDRRRPHVPAQRPDRHADDRAHRRPPDQSRHRLRRGRRARLDRQRDARRVQDDRRRADLDEGALPQPAHRRDRSRDGSGRSQHAVRRDVAAHPPQVERSARRARLQRERHLEDDRRRQDLDGCEQRPAARRSSAAASASTSSRIESERALRVRRQLRGGPSAARRTSATPTAARSSESRIKAAEIYRTDDKGATWRKVSDQRRLHDRATPAPTAGCSARSASIRRTRTRSTRWAWA